MSTHSSSDSAVCLVCVALTFFFSGLSGLSTSAPLHFCFAPAQVLQAVPCPPLGHTQAKPNLRHRAHSAWSPSISGDGDCFLPTPCSLAISAALCLASTTFACSSSSCCTFS